MTITLENKNLQFFLDQQCPVAYFRDHVNQFKSDQGVDWWIQIEYHMTGLEVAWLESVISECEIAHSEWSDFRIAANTGSGEFDIEFQKATSMISSVEKIYAHALVVKGKLTVVASH